MAAAVESFQMNSSANHHGTGLANLERLTRQYFTLHDGSRNIPNNGLTCAQLPHPSVERHPAMLNPPSRQRQGQLPFQSEILPRNSVTVTIDKTEVFPPQDHRSLEVDVMRSPDVFAPNNQHPLFRVFPTRAITQTQIHHHPINTATMDFSMDHGTCDATNGCDIKRIHCFNNASVRRDRNIMGCYDQISDLAPSVVTTDPSPDERYEGIMHQYNVMKSILTTGDDRLRMGEASPEDRPVVIKESLNHPVGGTNILSRFDLGGSSGGIASANASTATSTTTTNSQQKTMTIDPSCSRRIGKIRRYNSQTKSYGQWEDIRMPIPIASSPISNSDNSKSHPIKLSRGGKIMFHPGLIPAQKRLEIARAMHHCKLFRQYSFGGIFHEPRSHVLLSSRIRSCSSKLGVARASACTAAVPAPTGIVGVDERKLNSVATGEDCKDTVDEHDEQPGYSYHGIKMRALPIDLVPEVACYAEELARLYNLPNNEWNIGVDLIAYKVR